MTVSQSQVVTCKVDSLEGKQPRPPFSAFTARRAGHLLLGAAILSASVLALSGSVLAGSLVAPDSHASTGTSTSEPVAVLSNGYALDMDTTIQDSARDVQQVNYTLNVPSGVTLVSWTDTAALGPADRYSVNANNNAGNYSVGVWADTGTPKMQVAASTDLVAATGAHVSASSDSGVSQQQLWRHVSG
jgi:hypothetical protein